MGLQPVRGVPALFEKQRIRVLDPKEATMDFEDFRSQAFATAARLHGRHFGRVARVSRAETLWFGNTPAIRLSGRFGENEIGMLIRRVLAAGLFECSLKLSSMAVAR